MKSLQILTPHKECIFNCPFCISKSHKHNNKFINNYNLNYELWKNNLIKIINNNNDLKYVVITGTNEPMQSIDCINDIINIVRNTNKDIQIEIQTHYYKNNEIYNKLDVVAYSIPYINLISKIKPIGKIQRYVLILTDSFNNYKLDDILKLIPDSVKQITFKCLQSSNGINIELDEYIQKHKISNDNLDKLKEDINNYQGDLSIRLDEFCMKSDDRYQIFREDGFLYNSWEDIEKIN
ncbi:MAG: hypothetical protein IJZ79_06395 [Bacilli bacterium]|nr:hypothetical protein [Bacilli bacterium]